VRTCSNLSTSSGSREELPSELQDELIRYEDKTTRTRIKVTVSMSASANLFPLLVNISAVPYINLAGIFIIDRYFTSIF
jgi:hypothetical protein